MDTNFGIEDQMRKTGLKALVTLLTTARSRHLNRTLSIAILSTILTIALVALYFTHRTPE